MINDTNRGWRNEVTKTIRALKFTTSPTQIYWGGGREANKQTSSL